FYSFLLEIDVPQEVGPTRGVSPNRIDELAECSTSRRLLQLVNKLYVMIEDYEIEELQKRVIVLLQYTQSLQPCPKVESGLDRIGDMSACDTPTDAIWSGCRIEQGKID